MSFSEEVKKELCEVEPKRECCLKAECYGLWLFTRCFFLREGSYVTEHAGTARKMLELLAAGVGVSAELSYGMSRRKKPAYRVSLPEESARRQLLSAFGHTGLEPSLRINRAVLENECCLPAFLRGVFLSCGTMTDPQKEYHLEFAVPYKNLTNDLFTLLQEVPAFENFPAVTGRKSGYVVYWKDSGQIENFLTYMGAVNASMELMQVKMYKEAKNKINRQTNFETANMDKTLSASARQIAAIAAISDTKGLQALPEELQELARLRLDHPDMTLRELGERLGVTRSGVNHRLKRILEIGEKLMEGQGLDIMLGAERETEKGEK